MAIYSLTSTLGQQLASMMNHVMAAHDTAARLSGDFAAMETNGGATDADYDAIKIAMSISDDATAHALVSLVGTIQTSLNSIVALGGFYKWDPLAN